MRDAGRQHAERGQPVLLLERVLHRHPLADVLDHQHPELRLLVLLQGSEADLEVAVLSLGPAQADLLDAAVGTGQGGDRQQLAERPLPDLRQFAADQAAEGEVGGDHPLLPIEHCDAGR